MRLPARSYPTLMALAVALTGPFMAPVTSDLDLPSTATRIEPVQPISSPDLRLGGQPADAVDYNVSLVDLRSPCRNYADEPSTQPDAGFAECWNEKKTAWARTMPSAVGPSQPEMNSPLSSGGLKSGAPRQTPVP